MEESFPGNTPQMLTSSGPDHNKNYAQLQPRPRPWHLSQDEYLLVVRTLLDITLGPISIPVAVGPCQKWTCLIFIFKETVEVALPSFASNVETREESTICLQRCDLFLAS